MIITSSQPNVLAVNAQLPVKTLAELVAYAKANPGKLAYASVGNGSSSHLNMELLKSGRRLRRAARPVQRLAAGGDGDDPERDADDVRGDAAAAAADPGRQAPRDRGDDGEALSAAARSARDRGIGLSRASRRSPGTACWCRASTPKPVIAKLNAEINAILKQPDVVQKMNAQGFDLIGGTPEDFGALIRGEAETWAPVIRKVGLKID